MKKINPVLFCGSIENYLRKYMANMASMANEILLATFAMFAKLFVASVGEVFPGVFKWIIDPESYVLVL